MKSRADNMNRLQSILSRRSTGILFTLNSIVAINCWQLIQPGFDYDNTYSIAAAKSLSEGHGYSIKMASPDDLSKSSYQPINLFPPGYSLLLVVIQKLFNTPWIVSMYILNAIGLTGLVLLFRKLLFQLDFPAWIVHPAVLYFGFINQAFHNSNNTDLFALVFYLLGLSVMLEGVKSGINTKLKMVLAALAFGFTAYLKYLYIPLSVVPFLSLFIYGYGVKEKQLQSAAGKGFVVLTLMLISLMAFLYSISGQAMYMNPSATGFFPRQLIWLAPVIPASFLNFAFLFIQVENLTHIDFPRLMRFLSVINIGCIMILGYMVFRLYQAGRFKGKNFRTFYAIHALLFTITLFGLLSILTLIKSAHYLNIYAFWVYNMELRYYVVFSVLIIQFALFLILKSRASLKHTPKIFFYSLILFIFVEETVHGAYYCFKQMVVTKNYGFRQLNNRPYFSVMAMTKSASAGKENSIFCSNSRDFANLCSLDVITVYYDIEKLNNTILCSKPMRLIILINTRLPGNSVPILVNKGIKPYGTVKKNIYYYILDIPKSLAD
jgi:hypothetical protein